jgi:transcriptional regulator with XRE-family HTH domain
MNSHNEIPTLKIDLLPTMKLNDRIKILRLAKNITQEYMAEQLCIDTANYGRLERGKTKIDIDRLKKIATLLNIEISELLKEPLDQNYKTSIEIYLENILTELKSINNKL